MNIFKRPQKFDKKLLFEKIFKAEHHSFVKEEIDFLQTPHPENIRCFYSFYKELTSFRKSIFFDKLKELIEDNKNKEQQLKMTLFAQSLIGICVGNIAELISTENHTGGFGIHLFFIFFDAAEKFHMKECFKHEIINNYNDFVRESGNNSAIVRPYFDMKKEELGYEHF